MGPQDQYKGQVGGQLGRPTGINTAHPLQYDHLEKGEQDKHPRPNLCQRNTAATTIAFPPELPCLQPLPPLHRGLHQSPQHPHIQGHVLGIFHQLRRRPTPIHPVHIWSTLLRSPENASRPPEDQEELFSQQDMVGLGDRPTTPLLARRGQLAPRFQAPKEGTLQIDQTKEKDLLEEVPSGTRKQGPIGYC